MGGLLVCVIMCAVWEAGPEDCYQRAEERRGVHFNQMQLYLREERLSQSASLASAVHILPVADLSVI